MTTKYTAHKYTLPNPFSVLNEGENLCIFYGGPKGSNTNKFPKTQISLPKHKSIFRNTNQFSETQINFSKHKSVY